MEMVYAKPSESQPIRNEIPTSRCRCKLEGLTGVGSGMGSRHPGDPWVVTCGSQPGWVVWVTGNEPPTTRTGTG